ncbi:MAG: GTPase family protein [Wenzhouxiangella sp.]
MREWIKRFGKLRSLALVLSLLPLAILPLLGVAWLWQNAQLLLWVGATLLLALIAMGLNLLAVRREQSALPQAQTQAAEHWPAQAEDCWQQVEALAARVTPEDYPLNDGASLMRLGREVLNLAAGHFHPGQAQPLLEMTLPHTLAVIERAARELRQDIVENVPFSHSLSLGDMARARRWQQWYKRHETWIRAARVLFAPQSAAASELRRLAGNQIFQHGSKNVQTWLLREYVRKLGYHAIELYGGYARLDVAVPVEKLTRESGKSVAEVDPGANSEPLRWVIAGRSNAGKSSLVNALCRDLVAGVDVLPERDAGAKVHRLQRDGLDQVLIFEAPGFDEQPDAALDKLLDSADLVLWVSAANRADRQAERRALDAIRHQLIQAESIAPPLIVVMSQIDRLRPVREWQPPYPLNPPQGTKAEQIALAAAQLGTDLDVAAASIVPVCLREGAIYNVDDALWASLLNQLDGARRTRLLRCLKARRSEEQWSLLWRQLRASGRLLGQAARSQLSG